MTAHQFTHQRQDHCSTRTSSSARRAAIFSSIPAPSITYSLRVGYWKPGGTAERVRPPPQARMPRSAPSLPVGLADSARLYLVSASLAG